MIARMALAASAVGCKDATSAVAGAPCLTHQPIAATSLPFNGVLPSFGMKSLAPGARLTRRNRSLAAESPGLITGPSEPPFMSAS
jgi:hypothetical protein